MPIHRYAIISVLIVLNLSRSRGVKGFSLNRLIVNEEPLLVTRFPRVACSLEPSGMVASRMGLATEMCFPHFCASQTTNPSSSGSLSNLRLDLMEPYFLWYMYRGTPTPSHEQSSTFGSIIMTLTTPYPMK